MTNHNFKSVDAIMQTGLLQIGRFTEQSNIHPYRWHFEMLPAYPQVIGEIASLIRPHCQPLQGDNHARLIANTKISGLGSVIASQLNISLVYQKGCGQSPVFDYIGAYDVGHRSYLIIDEITKDIGKILHDIERVGLVVEKIITLIGFQEHIQEINNIPIVTILDWYFLLNNLMDKNYLHPTQYDTIHQFLKKENAL